jgi:hypothetical protein
LKVIALLVLAAFSASAVAQAQTGPAQKPAIDPRVVSMLGKLPAPGNVNDVLACAGANEVLWTDGVRADPYSREASEAKRKAGWYASVALNIFAVESSAVFEAITAARRQTPREKVLELAKSCRAAPDSWRE